MARKNRFAGILRARPLGAGPAEVSVVVLYDITKNRIRNKVSELCLGYGLERIQFSAFFGKINRNRRQQLSMQIAALVGDESARVRIIPILDAAVDETWSLDQYDPNAKDDAEKAPDLVESAETVPLFEDPRLDAETALALAARQAQRTAARTPIRSPISLLKIIPVDFD